MSLLDQENWNVTIHTWADHRRNHRLMPDPTCVFCDDDPRWQPGHEYDPATNVIRAKGEQ